MKFLLLLVTVLLMPLTASAKDVYQDPDTFVAESFDDKAPKMQRYLPDEELQKPINKIMRHKYKLRAFPYWRKGDRTVWILEEIGKYKPITTGIVVKEGVIETLKVLVYRESHGWEVRYPSFTDQFKNAKLKNNNKLDTPIDGISGATLSVKALTRLGQLALFFHKQVMENG
ncbi:MAG: FMN-binding protein [Rickettsiales bacterium]|nr:FMN-binding protein [Rickettsiales bacterium]